MMIIYIIISSNVRMTIIIKLLMNLLRLLEMPCLELTSATESSSPSTCFFRAMCGDTEGTGSPQDPHAASIHN